MSVLRWFRSFGALSLVLAVGGLAGCNTPSTDDDSADTDVAASELAAEPAPARHDKAGPMRGKHHGKPGGPAMLLGAALHELDLTDAQRSTIQKELDALRQDAGARADHDAARAALAAAVKSGRVDEAALLSKVAPARPDTARLAKALGVLHDTLTPAQRKELVSAVEERMEHMKRGGPKGDRQRGEAHEGKGHERGEAREGKGHERGEAHGRRDHERGRRGHGMVGRGEHGPLGHLLRGVSLSDAQRGQVREALSKLAPNEADRDAMKAQHEAFRSRMKERLASFASDSFDASAFVAPPEGAPNFGPDKMFGHMVKALAVVVPILDDGQRAELAKRIEEGPGAKHR